MTRVLLILFTFVLASTAFAQGPTNSGGNVGSYQKWPDFPPVGIGTALDGGPLNALHIHYDPDYADITRPAVLRFSQGSGTISDASGLLGLIPNLPDDTLLYSSLIRGQDMVLRANHGDLLLTTFWKEEDTMRGGAIRMATFPKTTSVPLPIIDTDFERFTILNNGNVGVDVRPNATTNLATPKEQFEIGGGVMPVNGQAYGVAGLSMYGGNRFEGMLLHPVDTGMLPYDPRYIAHNYWIDHLSTSAHRAHRYDSASSSKIAFDENPKGQVTLLAYPYSNARGLDDFTNELALQVMGNGVQVWSKDSTDTLYHNMMQIWRPGFMQWGITRNVNGLTMFETPMLISAAGPLDFTNFLHTRPTLGDQKTWMLAVNGSALFKEVLVLDTVWSDFVFDADYKLPSLAEVEAFTKEHHHLPGIPSAEEIKTNGIQVARTEAKLLQKIEEQQLYIIELSHKLDALERKFEVMQEGGAR